MFWVGGMIFYVLVIISVLRDPELSNYKLILLKKIALQFRKISYFVFLLFFISGIGILYSKGYYTEIFNPIFWQADIGLLLGIKLCLFGLLLISSVYHDFITGPYTFSYLETNTQKYEKYRKLSSFFGRLNLFVSIAIAILGTFISRGFYF
jgi:hypothetical protein